MCRTANGIKVIFIIRQWNCSLHRMLIDIIALILTNDRVVQRLRIFRTLNVTEYPDPAFAGLDSQDISILIVRRNANGRELHAINVEFDQLVAYNLFPVQAAVHITGPLIWEKDTCIFWFHEFHIQT